MKSNDQNPDWNQQINIGYQYPSVCDKIVLQLKDKYEISYRAYISRNSYFTNFEVMDIIREKIDP